MYKIITAAVLLAASASTAGAQGSRVYPTPTAGELIRVTPDSGTPFTGRLAAMGGDTLVLDPSDRDSAVMAVASRERVEVHRSHRELWSGLGALAGIAAGLVASQLQSGDSHNAGTKKASVAVVGGAAGGVVGGFFGFMVAPHRWQRLHARARRGSALLAATPATIPPPQPVDAAPAVTAEPPPPAEAAQQPEPAPTTPASIPPASPLSVPTTTPASSVPQPAVPTP